MLENEIKIGDVTFTEEELGALPESVAEKLTQTKGLYDNSSKASIENHNKARELETQLKELQTKKPETPQELPKAPEDSAKKFELPKEYRDILDKQKTEFESELNKYREHNINVEINNLKTKLKNQYSMLSEEKLNELVDSTDASFKNLPLSNKNSDAYKIIFNDKITPEIMDNISNLSDDRAFDRIKSNPELMAKVAKLAEESGLGVFQMAEGGYASEQNYQSQMEDFQAEFKKATTTHDRKRLANKIANLKEQARKMNFKIK